MSDSADSDSCDPVHGFGAADDDADDPDEVADFDELDECDGGCERDADVDETGLDVCGRGLWFELLVVPAAEFDELSDISTRTVSRISTRRAITEASKAKRRRQ